MNISCDLKLKVCAIICEYNPFHNGHAAQMTLAREATRCDYVLCVMSGAFTQRGEVACLASTHRARLALMSGADIVLELPALHSIRSARDFAFGAVSIVNDIGVCDSLSFGCEDVEYYNNHVSHAQINPNIKQSLSRGESFAKAAGLPNMPNLVLGIEYANAAMVLGSDISLVPVERVKGEVIASASEIRKLAASGGDFARYVPNETVNSMNQFRRNPTLLDNAYLAKLRTMNPKELERVLGVTEGIEHRVIRSACRASTRDELIQMVKSKRTLHTSISRMLTCALLGITKEHAALHPKPTYTTLLGFRESARPLVAAIARESRVKIVTQAAEIDYDSMRVDIEAEALASLCGVDYNDRNGAGFHSRGIVKV